VTRAAIVAGLTPLGLWIGPEGAARFSMARAVIGGLIASTLLSPRVVPVLDSLSRDATAALCAWISARSRRTCLCVPR